jgi:hypothetical protein
MTKQDVKDAVTEALEAHGHICLVFPTEADRVLVQDVVNIAKGVKDKGISYAITGMVVLVAVCSVVGIAALVKLAPEVLKVIS